MRTHSKTSSFKRDWKRIQKQGKDLSKLKTIMDFLIDEKPLPPELKDHQLTGNLQAFRECHVEPNWLLVYQITDSNTCVSFARTGSHSELFK